MALPTFTFPADASAGAPAGDYVPAELAEKMAQTLSTLVWAVLYGKSHDASSKAVSAEQFLSQLKAGKIVA